MFVHLNQLRHLLPPEAYFSEAHYRLELERVLLPGWHFVATLTDLPRDGDTHTLTLFDRPLLLQRQGGEVQASLHVRSHRHRQPTDQPIRTSRAGDLVFVCLHDDGPTLAEQLGSAYADVVASYSAPYRQVWRWQTDYQANWKIPLENGVESYHIPCLHSRTFGNYPREENVGHELHKTWTSYRTDEMDRWVKYGIHWTTWWLGVPFTGAYTHRHVFPNLTFVTMDTMRMAQIVVPTSATTSRTYVWLYAPYGPNRGVIAWLYARGNAWMVKEVTRRVLAEDAPIFPDVQRGLQASVFRGVIGRREERVYVFQEYLARLCGLSVDE